MDGKMSDFNGFYAEFFVENGKTLVPVEMQILTVLLKHPFPTSIRGIWDGIVENCFDQIRAQFLLSIALGNTVDTELETIIKEEKALREKVKKELEKRKKEKKKKKEWKEKLGKNKEGKPKEKSNELPPAFNYFRELGKLLKSHGVKIPAYIPVHTHIKVLERMGVIFAREAPTEKRGKSKLMFADRDLVMAYLKKKKELAGRLLELKNKHGANFKKLLPFYVDLDAIWFFDLTQLAIELLQEESSA